VNNGRAGFQQVGAESLPQLKAPDSGAQKMDAGASFTRPGIHFLGFS
jgi:hypothetical protein